VARAPSIDRNEVYRLHDCGVSQGDIGRRLGCNQSHISRILKARPEHRVAPTNGDVPTTTLQRVEIIGEPVKGDDSPDLKAQIDVLAAEVADLKAHQREVDQWIATLQAQSQDTAHTRAALRSAETRSLAQPYAEPAQTWDAPEDAKSVPFNLSLPRGLKRLLDAEAKRTGLPASRLVQKLLMAALIGEGVHGDA
jgi:hypothetical protein